MVMKIRKSCLAIISASLISVLLTCCNSNPIQVNVDDLIVPTFSDDKRINIGSWNWTVKNFNNNQLESLKEAGLNLLIGTFNDRNDNADSSLISRASEYGIDMIIDKRPWEGTIPIYADKENFLGYCVFDEPASSEFLTLKTMKENWDKSDLKDKMFFVNLNPSYSHNIAGSYEQYVKSYVEDIGLEMVSFDYYPLYRDLFSDKTALREDWLYNFSIASYYARKNNIPLWYTLLTTEHNAGGLSYINPTAKDLEYQMYVAMAFGSKYLIHYTGTATGADHINPIFDKDGNPTDSYFDVKEASETIGKWDSVYMNFDSIGFTGVFGTEDNTGLLDYILKNINIKDSGALESVQSNYDLVVGHFEDEYKNKGFVLTNMTNPYDNQDIKAKLKFNSNYQGVKIFSSSGEEVKSLTNGEIELDIISGSGIFVVPLKIK